MSSTLDSTDSTDNLLELQQLILRPTGAVLLDNEAGLGEFEELCWQYLHKLPQGLRLGQIKTRIEIDHGAFGGRRYEFDSRLFADCFEETGQPEPVGQLMVTLYRKPRGGDTDIFLELEQCQLWYPHMRGKGLGKTLFGLVQQLAFALEVKAITAIAIYDGRFVWPALGFRFGDYLPEEEIAVKFRQRFLKFCQRYNLAAPDVSDWDAPDFARFLSDLKIPASVGHSMDRERQVVEFGRAFLLSRRPFFLSYPLTQPR
ncbi:MAG TPA: hypothetical protein VH186_14370 [Chloroflexia bacterium]|nr:hypothetical protein [Chloroflexia bacterium]